MRKAECSECYHSGRQIPYAVIPEIQRTPSDFLPFLRELPGGAALLEPEQAERVSSPPNGERRTQ